MGMGCWVVLAVLVCSGDFEGGVKGVIGVVKWLPTQHLHSSIRGLSKVDR